MSETGGAHYGGENVGLSVVADPDATGYGAENATLTAPPAHDGIAYGGVNVGVVFLGADVADAFGSVEVSEDQPFPHIWYISPARMAEHAEVMMAIVGTGFGDDPDQYAGEVWLGHRQMNRFTQIVSWEAVAASGNTPPVIDGNADVADPAHERIVVHVPYDIETCLVFVNTMTVKS